MNLKKYAEKLGKRNLIISVLVDLKRSIKEDIVLYLKQEQIFLMYNGNEGSLINLNVVFK